MRAVMVIVAGLVLGAWEDRPQCTSSWCQPVGRNWMDEERDRTYELNSQAAQRFRSDMIADQAAKDAAVEISRSIERRRVVRGWTEGEE